jgi:ketosteroid isomerase-like protein
MSVEDNVAVARRFYDCFTANDIDGVMATLADDARFRVPGKPGEFASAGWYDKAKVRRLFDFMVGSLDGPLRMEVTSVLADGDRVAMEVTSEGHLRNGRVYNNEYFVLFKITGGKIIEVREYNDTLHAHKIWVEA